MGVRGSRSAADLSTMRFGEPVNLSEPIDVQALARQYGVPRREAERALKRAERRGEATSRIARDGREQWFWIGRPAAEG